MNRRITRRAGRAMTPALELLEGRQLLSGLHAVKSPTIDGQLLATAAIAANDIWATGNVVTGPGAIQPVAEHFNRTSWSAVPTPSFTSDSLSGVAGVASNDVWAVGSTGS